MFPTSIVARLNWSLEEWPRSARCEKEELMSEPVSDGNMKMDSVRSPGYLASLVLEPSSDLFFFALTQETLVCQNMSKDVTCRSGLRCLF